MNPFSPIAIVSAGCVLPGAGNVQEFWDILSSGTPQFSPLSDSRWPIETFLDPAFSAPDSTYSALAAAVEDRLFIDPKSDLPRTHQMLQKALKECVGLLTKSFFKNDRTAVILGCMNPGDEYSLSFIKGSLKRLLPLLRNLNFKNSKSLVQLEEYISQLLKNVDLDPKIHYPSSLARLAHETLGTQGLAFCADSACASSLTAIDIACQHLQLGQADTVISGGIEGNLGLETYIPFSHLGVLARKHCLPFDSRSDGIVQGEGAVIFLLKRLKDAVRLSLPILGVIDNITSSSNGSKASLFSPSFERQKDIYEEMNKTCISPEVFYIEGHGTGTPVGDSAEFQAITESFKPQSSPIYLGSVKSLIGHTKGAAGAAGLLKCILAIKHKTIPPSKYFNEAPGGSTSSHIVVNKEPITIASKYPLHMRVNSAGFGGANYHLSLTEYQPQQFSKNNTIQASNEEVCLVGQSEIPYQTNSLPERANLFKIPPHELMKLDPSQTLGLIALSQTLERSLISLENIPSHRIGCISASHTRTNKIEALTETIFLKQIERFLSETLEEDPSPIKQIRENLISLDESSCQSINSMTSGRLAHEFDLHGVNFHIDADFNSESHAILVAHHLIHKKRLDLIVILSINESIPGSPILVQRNSITCSILAGRDFANSYGMPILANLKNEMFPT